MLNQADVKKAFKDTLNLIELAMYIGGYATVKVQVDRPITKDEWNLFKICFTRMVEAMHLVCTLVLLDDSNSEEINSFGIDVGYP